MDARFLTAEHREQLKRVVYTRRDEIDKIIKRMEARHWYTDDAVLLNLRSAYFSLHAAVQALAKLDGTPVMTHPPALSGEMNFDHLMIGVRRK